LQPAAAAARRPLRWSFAAYMLLALGSVGCGARAGQINTAASAAGAGQRRSTAGPIEIITTTGMVADLVEHVGGKQVSASALMGEGVDPHLYKASTGDVSRLSRADMVFYSGLHLEGRMGEVLERLARKKPVYAVTDDLDRDRLLRVGERQFDPHVWFDVGLWSETLAVVERALSEFDPDHAADYRSNAEAYRHELAELDAWCREQVESIDESRRVLVTAHDAFHYFGRTYEIEVQAIQGISTQSEAAVSTINDLVELISQRQIKAVFVESSVSERNIRALVEGCQARGHAVRIGGQLFSDAMGRAGTPEGTYAGMVRHNVKTITQALR
jgi:manganese/zinc/iron transport system substrate-binding protein